MKAHLVLPAILICLAASQCHAGSVLSIRLIEATNEARGNAKGIEDVVGILGKSLAFRNYKLVASSSLRLPAKNATTVLGGYKVKCSGQAKGLAITVVQGKRQLLKTKVVLRRKKPVMLGGLPSKKGKRILVFMESAK